MKKLFYFIAFSLLLTSCNFTEEISFKEDGSGEFLMNYDMSEVMKTLEGMGMGKKADTSEVQKKKQKMDSTIYFRDMLVEKADSISKLPQDEQDMLKSLEPIVMKMKMDEETGEMDFGFGADFTSIAELPEVLNKIELAKKLNSQKNPQYSKMDNSAFSKATENSLENVEFKFDGKTFSRHINPDYKPSKENLEALDKEMNQMGNMKEMFESMSYTLRYNFPKKVATVSNSEAKISEDGKTVTLKLNFMDMINDPKIMALDVVLED